MFKFALGNQSFLAADKDYIVEQWSLEGERLNAFQAHGNEIMDVDFSPNGKLLASAGLDNRIQLWDMEKNVLHQRIEFNSQVYSVHFLDDKTLVSAHKDHSIVVWGTDGARRRDFPGHRDAVLYLSLSPDKRTLVSAGKDRTIRLWDLEHGNVQVLEGHTDLVAEANFSPDGESIVSGGADIGSRIL